MIKKYTVTKIVYANSAKEVLDIEKGEIVDISLAQEIDKMEGVDVFGFAQHGQGKRN